MQDRERVFAVGRDGAEHRPHVVVGATGGELADAHALGLQAGVELVAHHSAMSRTTSIPEVRAHLHRPRATTGCTLIAGCAQMLDVHRLELVHVELFVDAAVAPDLLAVGGPDEVVETLGRGEAALDEPVGPAEAARRVDREVLHDQILVGERDRRLSRRRPPC